MKRLFRKLHLWLSFPFGLIIAVTCFTGSLLVFEKEVYELGHSDLVFVEPSGTPLPLAQLVPIVASTTPDDVSITGVTISEDPKRAYKVNLSKPKHAAMYVNQYTGEVLGQYGRTPFYKIVFYTHRWLMDTPQRSREGIFWGRVIVGVSTIFFVVALITGIVLWWPRRWKYVGRNLKMKFGKSFWYSLHTSAGIYVLVVLLALALTGLTWSFDWYRSGFYSLFGGSTKRVGTSKGTNADQDYVDYDVILEQMSGKEYKELKITPNTATLILGGWGNQFAADVYKFDATTGEVKEYIPYSESPHNGKIRGWIMAVHLGNWGGYFSKIITFLAGLIGASLPLTGYYLWWKRIRKG